MLSHWIVLQIVKHSSKEPGVCYNTQYHNPNCNYNADLRCQCPFFVQYTTNLFQTLEYLVSSNPYCIEHELRSKEDHKWKHLYLVPYLKEQ